MSLRVRLIAFTVLILVVSLALGAGLAVWHAEQSVNTELLSVLEVGGQTLRNGVEDLVGAADPPGEVHRLVGTFDGNRHVRAVLVGRNGETLETSRPLMPDMALPRWFLWAVDPGLETVRVGLPASVHGGAIVLLPFPDNEAGEVWKQYGDSGVTLAAFCLLTSLLIMSVVGRGLRPLARLSDAFTRIGAGDYSARVPRSGAPELVRLAEGFNQMAQRLATMQRQNGRLHEQLLALQDEERADLARDLHDEIGPYLFSVNVSAATVSRLVEEGRAGETSPQIRDIREAVGHVQKHVKAILARLRPVRAVEFGLTQAVGDLVAFWRSRHDRIAFRATVSPAVDRAGEPVLEVAYRVIQEGLSNAVRHGSPSRIVVTATVDAADVVVDVIDDGGGALAPHRAGFGLAGMHERVGALGGSVAAGPDAAAGGWRVTARLPAAPPDAVAEPDGVGAAS